MYAGMYVPASRGPVVDARLGARCHDALRSLVLRPEAGADRRGGAHRVHHSRRGQVHLKKEEWRSEDQQQGSLEEPTAASAGAGGILKYQGDGGLGATAREPVLVLVLRAGGRGDQRQEHQKQQQ